MHAPRHRLAVKRCCMLDKQTPNASAEVHPTPREVDELVDEVSDKLARLAKVPVSKKSIFKSEIKNAVELWLEEFLLDRQDQLPKPPPIDAGLLPLIANIRPSLLCLHRQIEDLHHRLSAADERRNAGRSDETDDEARSCLRPESTNDALRSLSVLKDALNDFQSRSRRRRGRPSGTKHYPGLEVLVSGLQLGSLICDGKLTLNKRYGKGTLIESLNYLKASCQVRPLWKVFAAGIPPGLYRRASCQPATSAEGSLMSQSKS
jgi:hypothetical protein